MTQGSSQPKTPPAKKVRRKIHFYRALCGVGKTKTANKFEAQKIFETIDKLDIAKGARYLPVQDDDEYCVWIDRLGTYPRIKFGRIRRSNLPIKERKGKLSELGLHIEEGIVELCHVQFFDDNIIGVDFNFFAPRVSHLPDYIQAKAPGIHAELKMSPLVNSDIASEIGQMQDIRLIELSLDETGIAELAQKDQSLSDGLKACQAASGAKLVDIILRPKPYSRSGTLDSKYIQIIKDLVGVKSFREHLAKGKVKGYRGISDKIDIIDLLSDRLVSEESILLEKGRSRVLDSASAYKKIEEAYSRLKSKLLTAKDLG